MLTRATWRSISSRSARAVGGSTSPEAARCLRTPSHTRVLNLGSRHAGDAAGFGFAILQNRMRDIIPVAHAALVRMRRAHPVAAVVEEAAGQKAASP